MHLTINSRIFLIKKYQMMMMGASNKCKTLEMTTYSTTRSRSSQHQILWEQKVCSPNPIKKCLVIKVIRLFSSCRMARRS